MKLRNTLYAITLIAYALWMAHSVIPHHHHRTLEEAHHAHHHQDGSDHDHDHHHDNNHNETTDHEGHLFFLNHDLNGDVISHKKTVSTKKSIAPEAKPTITTRIVVPPRIATNYLSFRPPQDEGIPLQTGFTTRALRAPPLA